MNPSSTKHTIFYVAKYVGRIEEPMAYILAQIGEVHRESLTKCFAEQTGDVYVPLVTRDQKTGRVRHGYHAYVFKPPRAQGASWEIYSTIDPMHQGEAFESGRGAISNEDEAQSLAGAMSETGGHYVVFSFTPYAHGKPFVAWNPLMKGRAQPAE